MERRDLCYIELFIKIWKSIYNKRTSVAVSAADQIRYYRFTPATTGTYVIASTNNTGDPYDYLYLSTGTQLAYNDDGNSNLNVKIEYTFTAGTTYIIGVKVYSSSSTGQYTLTVTQTHNGENTTLANAKMIAVGTPTNVAITDTYVITSTNNTGDPYGYLYAANGTKLKETKNGIVKEATYTYDKNDRLLTEKNGSTVNHLQL